jgi:alkanesulfonate monooxygenase SsuD/methylene tetrahydromethanopterin reductase-like flavin-dependent oxidoreductase (luciferase family)
MRSGQSSKPRALRSNEEAATGSWPKWTERSERLVEATDIIRKLWSGHQIDHSGNYYKINARLYDPPTQTIPLLMAGNGPKAMRRCGQYADGLITDPKTWKEHKIEFQKGASDAGKDPARMPVFIEQYVVVGGRNELNEAADLWRFGPKAWKHYFNIRDPKTIQDRAEAEVPLEKVTEGWPVGTGGSREGTRGSVQERRHRGSYPFWPTRSATSDRFLWERNLASITVCLEKSRLIGRSRMISQSNDPAIWFELDGT